MCSWARPNISDTSYATRVFFACVKMETRPDSPGPGRGVLALRREIMIGLALDDAFFEPARP